MDNEEYADWFGIPSNQENKDNEDQKNKEELNLENNNNLKINNELKKSDKNNKHIKSLIKLISKKRKPAKEDLFDNQNKENSIKLYICWF